MTRISRSSRVPLLRKLTAAARRAKQAVSGILSGVNIGSAEEKRLVRVPVRVPRIDNLFRGRGEAW